MIPAATPVAAGVDEVEDPQRLPSSAVDIFMGTATPNPGPVVEPEAVPSSLQATFTVAASGCWLSTRVYNGTDGYGSLNYLGERWRHHRLFWSLLVGPIPAGYQVDHLCRVKACVNPAHLEPVTQTENLRRQAAVRTHCPKGHLYGEKNTGWASARGSIWRRCKTCAAEVARRDYWRRKGQS